MNTAAMPTRPVTLFAALALGAFLSACSISITAPAHDNDRSAGRVQLSKPGAARFECVQSPTGECNYALYTSSCQTASGEGGKPATTCTHQVIEQFTLKQGQSYEVRDLPSNFKQCMKVESMPAVPSCE